MKPEREKPLGLDLSFDDALRRFIATDPAEVAENMAAAKEKRGPPAQSPPPVKEPEKPLD